MTIVLNTTHLGSVGGGENYLMRLAIALDDISDFSVVHNWPKEFEQNNGFYRSFKQYDGFSKPDVYLYCSHFYAGAPIGKRNFMVSFFPKQSLRPAGVWDGCISICDYTAKYVKSYWSLSSDVIYPCIEPSLYSVGKKSRKIISIGHFFEEADGHSKNQHVLIDIYRNDPRLQNYELVLIGSANAGDEKYINKLRSLAQGINCRIEINRDGAFVRKELSTASHLVSLNGYGRTDPSQVEHWGLLYLEAIASGVVPIGHKSGGYAEIDGIVAWERPEEIGKLITSNVSCPPFQQKFRIESFNESVKAWLSKLS